MPKTKFQDAVFGIIMSYIMAYGMEVYNTAIKMGFNLKAGGFSSMTNIVFLEAFKETLYMGVIVFVISSLFGNKIGEKFAEKYCDPEKDNPYFCRIMRQAGTIAIMCPTMSLVATILFNIIMGGASWANLPAIWVGTVIKNFHMAFFLEYVCGNRTYPPDIRLYFQKKRNVNNFVFILTNEKYEL